MSGLPASITIVIAVLAAFLIFITALKYAIEDHFIRMRLIMTSFFFFIVFTLSVSFWKFAIPSLPYTIPCAIAGILLGYLIGVRTEQEKIHTSGLRYYMRHFAQVDVRDFVTLQWWSVVNFYSVMGALLLVNLVGLSTVFFQGVEYSAIRTSAVGAFLLGTLVPYLIHLWTINPKGNSKN